MKVPLSKLSESSRFVDISIYRRIEKDVFVSLTYNEFDSLAPDNTLAYYEIPGISDEYNYALSVFAATNNTFATGVKLSDIIALAGITNKAFLKQLQTGLPEIVGEDFVAELCAKKIISYTYGKCVQEIRDNSGYVYINFFRTTFKNRQREYPLVLSKPFINTTIKRREVSPWEKLTEMNSNRERRINVIR